MIADTDGLTLDTGDFGSWVAMDGGHGGRVTQEKIPGRGTSNKQAVNYGTSRR